ncbi:MAG: DUF1156 domain-containing protein, partial [Pirellulales bacterium]|nr:DUF1156 domain-containing protein [Pirellulales bacterium]
AIPLEALRLGCASTALDLNPVAHLVEQCTLMFPHLHARADESARGIAGPKDSSGRSTWGGLSKEIEYWAAWVQRRAFELVGDLYPPLPEKKSKASPKQQDVQRSLSGLQADGLPPGHLSPLAYLWTRTVRCKNPGCGANVPLFRYTWLRKKKGSFAALEVTASKRRKTIEFRVKESSSQAGLGFDPTCYSKAGNATCPFCGTVADSDYVKAMACDKKLGITLMAVACGRPGTRGKQYLVTNDDLFVCPADKDISSRIDSMIAKFNLPPFTESIEANPRSMDVHNIGMTKWADIYTPRQIAAMFAFCAAVREASDEARRLYGCRDKALAVCSYLALALDKLADYGNSLCAWHYGNEQITHLFKQQSLPMVWDFAESNPFGGASGSWVSMVKSTLGSLEKCEVPIGGTIHVTRGSATELPWDDCYFDAVITDPPYYDNVSYSNLSDFFYVWLKRTIGPDYPEHFATELTPKKKEAIAATYRHKGDKSASRGFYETMMAKAFAESYRVLKPNGIITVVYAHKTTLGWATLVDALRTAGFVVTEAWPLDTEMKNRFVARETAALASSIFLVARKRRVEHTLGQYESEVQPELLRIVRERVDVLWEAGIAGSDLIIASVGAGLRAFTKYRTVEFANGEPVPAEKFLAEVEGVVLDTMLGKLFGQARTNVSAIDPASRFYVLWRFVYKAAEIDAGEAIVFTYAQHVELDGPLGLSTGKDALVEKKKSKYRPRDFTERGDNDRLGLPSDDGQPAPLIDVLHRVLWLMENSPRKLREFLAEADPDRERLRILAQSLAGAGLSGKSEEDAEKLIGTTAAEKSALGKLLANWKSVIENTIVSKGEREDKKHGQTRLFE